ncbi:Scramblase-domain-containing protein [Laetiporus sulphureus 93-53]|uniref:Phospholipid scramblase n=1 Tax=Laetiporus sulphureus 93-53 TaxID=1314785 RepID=A0A165H5Y9_9APHY|nr:Scramblase-domain-containing protein [Laetiporus sulphureus 93-53]KZT11288.1 Scramblase-domain-containing protein [Laetiporus sulphureus 93-53]
MLARNIATAHCLPRCFPARHVLLCREFRRHYALSRFPDRAPGGSRRRPRIDPLEKRSRLHPESGAFQGFPYEEQPSVEQSPLWEASRREPFSDPEEGLKQLLLGHNQLVVTRQIEMLNLFIGFEQSNRYVITDENEVTLGYIAEEPRGMLSSFGRQVFRTHRPFRAVVMDSAGTPILWLRRPFAFINSRMFVQRLKNYTEYTVDGEPVLDTFGEVQQRWHLWRRRYDLFLREDRRRILSVATEPQPEPDSISFKQFALIDEGLLAWSFYFKDARGEEIASVRRAFRGLGREIFTDTGQYFVRFNPTLPDSMDLTERRPTVIRGLSLEERALVLAMAVNIDFDYFSRHSRGGPGFGFWWFSVGE